MFNASSTNHCLLSVWNVVIPFLVIQLCACKRKKGERGKSPCPHWAWQSRNPIPNATIDGDGSMPYGAHLLISNPLTAMDSKLLTLVCSISLSPCLHVLAVNTASSSLSVISLQVSCQTYISPYYREQKPSQPTNHLHVFTNVFSVPSSIRHKHTQRCRFGIC